MKLRIKDVLREKKITAVSLAEKIGIAQPSMSNIVNEKVMPSLDTLEKIANALGVEVIELFALQKDGFTALIDYNGQLYRFDSIEALKEFIANIGKE